MRRRPDTVDVAARMQCQAPEYRYMRRVLQDTLRDMAVLAAMCGLEYICMRMCGQTGYSRASKQGLDEDEQGRASKSSRGVSTRARTYYDFDYYSYCSRRSGGRMAGLRRSRFVRA